jgi:hypothetical protein
MPGLELPNHENVTLNVRFSWYLPKSFRQYESNP